MTTIKNISLTGYRILKILELLSNNDYSRNELIELLSKDPIIDRNLSDDTITMYVNTLRINGFQISRPHRSNKFNYQLIDGMPKLFLDDGDIEFLQKIKLFDSEMSNWRGVYDFNESINALYPYIDINNKKKVKEIIESKPFSFKLNKIIEIFDNSIKSSVVHIDYESPNSGTRVFEVIPKHLSLENHKMYIWCTNINEDQTHYLRLDRIKNITILKDIEPYQRKQVKSVKFKIINQEAIFYEPDQNEIIVEKTDNYVIVQASYTNEFWLMQKILSYGKDCIVLESEEFKQNLLNKIQNLAGVYDEN